MKIEEYVTRFRMGRWVFGNYCSIHDLMFRSDLCPPCVKVRIVKQETHDDRKEWHRSEGTGWPIKGRIDSTSTD